MTPAAGCPPGQAEGQEAGFSLARMLVELLSCCTTSSASKEKKKGGQQTSEPGFTRHETSGWLPAELRPVYLLFPEPVCSFSRENPSPGDVVLDNKHDGCPCGKEGE